jgi:hypothetical protein
MNSLASKQQFVSKCPKCEDSVTKDGKAPRERLCRCGTWVEFVEQFEQKPEGPAA